MKKILLVEDDAFIRNLYELAFKEAGFEVSIAGDGQEAINMAHQNTFDAILLDIMLPKLSGLDVLKSFRDPYSRARYTPVFLVTNLGQEEIVKDAYKIGVKGFFLKAKVMPKDLVAKINEVLLTQPPTLSSEDKTA